MSNTRTYHLVYPDPITNEEEPSGGYVEVHITHNSHEAERNVETAIILAKVGFKIRLLMIDDTPHTKNPDAYFFNEQVTVEFKHNFTPTRSAIEHAVRAGRKQADYLLLHILSSIDANHLLDGLKNRLYFADNVKGLWLIWQERLYYFERREFFDGTIDLKIQ
ncbi:hypothetical protein [Spirosoma montaniterrae]|uniref:tRNA nuclease CdiA C-terminal domain-containing protein n=1 Tax=Spirosoma montaniterrae TaxID=1178516 RepID=A0A1P9WRZ6_9BACT|nr:hypothetical protein [Spirosoma montaniterrae]AQG78139.1 hypothetical protein AWR27_01485 [Spirosoma montaniterrae]